MRQLTLTLKLTLNPNSNLSELNQLCSGPQSTDFQTSCKTTHDC